MSSSIRVPGTLAETLTPELMGALEDKLAPPPALRARARIEIEIEAAGEGTFTITVAGGVPTQANKSFAKDPLISVHVAKGGWPLLQRVLQALADGLPQAPLLRPHLTILQSPKAGEIDALIATVKQIADASVRFDVKGGGVYTVARGPIDEATRLLTISLDAAHIDALLQGASPSIIKAGIGGDRGVLAIAAAALAPLLERLR